MDILLVTLLMVYASLSGANGSDGQKSATQSTGGTSGLLNKILTGMDSRIRPDADGPAVDVDINFHVISFSGVSEEHMDYTMDIYLRQRWRDDRLAWLSFNNHSFPLSANSKTAAKIWLPDLFFPNEKRANFHMVTVPNVLLRIYPNGTVEYSTRLTLTLACAMMLSHFPMDQQKCSIGLESFGYDVNHLHLIWTNAHPIQLDDQVELPQFTLSSVEHNQGVSKYSLGEFSKLSATFTLDRQFGYYLCQTYVPSFLIVVLSWISFWINMDAVPARISLGVTSVLTMTTQFSGSRSNMPRVSYPKALDIWMAMCMVFVFGSLLEFAIVNVLSRSKKTKEKDSEKEKEPTSNCPEKSTFLAFEQQESVKEGPGILLCLFCFKSRRELASAVDKLSRFLFPGTFLVFNSIYWPIYLSP